MEDLFSKQLIPPPPALNPQISSKTYNIGNSDSFKKTIDPPWLHNSHNTCNKRIILDHLCRTKHPKKIHLEVKIKFLKGLSYTRKKNSKQIDPPWIVNFQKKMMQMKTEPHVLKN